MLKKIVSDKDIITIEIEFAELLKQIIDTKPRIDEQLAKSAELNSKKVIFKYKKLNLIDEKITMLINTKIESYKKLIEYTKQDASRIDFLFKSYSYFQTKEELSKIREMLPEIYEALPKTGENIVKFIKVFSSKSDINENLIEFIKSDIDKVDIFSFYELYSMNYNYNSKYKLYEVLPKTTENITVFLKYCLTEIAQRSELDPSALNNSISHDRAEIVQHNKAELSKILQDLGTNPLKKLEYDQKAMRIIFEVLCRDIYETSNWEEEKEYETQEIIGYETGYGGGGSTVEFPVYGPTVYHHSGGYSTERYWRWLVNEYTISLFKSIPLAKRKELFEELARSLPGLARKLKAGKAETPAL